jgi:1-acyl-sn-glycerol-3-phosphate acyltransferase
MILYWFCWIVLRIYFVVVLRIRVEGTENFPRRGSFILCSNHVSWLDPLLLGAMSPRRLFYMTKAEAFASPLANRILRTVGAFPVRRHTADRGAIRRALHLLGKGRTVAVFPEGTRSRNGSIGRAEPGAALLAVWSGADVLPVAISGAYRPGRLRLRYGPILRLTRPDNHRHSGAALQRMADEQIMGAVAALLPGGPKGPRVAVDPA